MQRESLDGALQVLGDPFVGQQLTVAGDLGASGTRHHMLCMSPRMHMPLYLRPRRTVHVSRSLH